MSVKQPKKTKSKRSLEARFDSIRKEAKETYELFVEQDECFSQYMDEEDLKWKDDLEDELHRIRKSLKKEVKVKSKDGVVAYVPRPNTEEYLHAQQKRLKNVAKDMETLFSAYELSGEDSA